MFLLVFLIGGLVIGLLIGGVLLRSSVAIVRSLLNPNSSQSTHQQSGWTNQQVFGQPVGQFGTPQAANPYSAPVAAPAFPGAVVGEVLPMPTFGKAILIIFLSFLVNFLTSSVIGFITIGIQPDSPFQILLQSGNVIFSAVAFIAILKYFLPTTYLWSFAVMVSYTLLCIAIGLVLFLALFLPMLFFA